MLEPGNSLKFGINPVQKAGFSYDIIKHMGKTFKDKKEKSVNFPRKITLVKKSIRKRNNHKVRTAENVGQNSDYKKLDGNWKWEL